MTVDPLEWLSARNPAPQGSTAPSLESMLARLESAGPLRGRRRIGIALGPALAIAAALAIVAAVVVLAVTHLHRAPAHLPPASRTAPSVPTPSSLMPPGGMRGALVIQGAAAPGAGGTLVSFSQCPECRAGASVDPSRMWEALTVDGGRSWHIAPTSLDLSMLAFSGTNGWAEGFGPDRQIRFFASHDGGRSWHAAVSHDPAPGWGDVSAAGGEVWSLGNGCTGTRCLDAILRARAGGARLVQTAAQPPLGHSMNVSVVATGPNDAYVLTDGTGGSARVRVFATHDGGRSWNAIMTPCPQRGAGQLYAGGAGALWASCTPGIGPQTVRQSIDGGHDWSAPIPGIGDMTLQPTSARVAWGLINRGALLRTSDGGRHWTKVWSPGQPETAAPTNAPPGLNRGWSEALVVQSARTATVIVQVSGGHPTRTNFVTYRTTDGGHTWRPSVVRLPPG